MDDPIKILDGIVAARKKLLMGFKGNPDVDPKKLEKAMIPSLYTMSLSGEPTIYPRLGAMFKEIRRRGAVSFLVTNGLNPKAIKKLKKDEMPTQITVSTNAPNEELFLRWHRTTKKKPWKHFLKTLDVLNSLEGKVRRVIRLTLVKEGKGETPAFNDITNVSDSNVKEYAEIIRRANPDFVHVKGYKSVGYARERLGYDKQPWFKEVKIFAKKLEKELANNNYEIAAEDLRSCVVMLSKKGKKLKITKP
jgi:tRNA wybutosine-synthesizing protein 1